MNAIPYELDRVDHVIAGVIRRQREAQLAELNRAQALPSASRNRETTPQRDQRR